MAAALVVASAPFRSAGAARGRPAISGVTSSSLTLPSRSSATKVGPVVVISSSPSEPWTTQARSVPRGQHLGQGLDPGLGEDAQKLTPRPGRIGERAHEVEDGAGAEFDPRGSDMAHGAMMTGRHEEADIGAPQRLADEGHIGIDIDAEGAQHIGRAGLGGGGAVAMLRLARPQPRSRWPLRWRC